MLYKKAGFPDEGDYVICMVKRITYHTVFVNLDEYNAIEGIIHVSEVSPGRIRNIRDFVKPGKRIVCRVLRANKEKGQLELSLRRVSAGMTKKKNTEYKLEQKAEKILEAAGRKLGMDLKTAYEELGYRLIEVYGSLDAGFQGILKEDAKVLNIKKEYLEALTSIAREKIKPIKIKISKTIIISSLAPDGIDVIKDTLNNLSRYASKKGYEITQTYVSAPRYRLTVFANDYKTGEKVMEELVDYATSYAKQKEIKKT